MGIAGIEYPEQEGIKNVRGLAGQNRNQRVTGKNGFRIVSNGLKHRLELLAARSYVHSMTEIPGRREDCHQRGNGQGCKSKHFLLPVSAATVCDLEEFLDALEIAVGRHGEAKSTTSLRQESTGRRNPTVFHGGATWLQRATHVKASLHPGRRKVKFVEVLG